MKKVISLVLAVVFAFALASVAFAHSGGTDSKGGHTDRSTGEYHYHHGYSAHQHEDLDGDGDLDCPYDFVDKTGQNSGSTYRSSYSSNTPKPVYTPKPTLRPSEKDKAAAKRDALDTILLGISPFVISFGIAFSVRAALDKKQKRQEEAERKRKELEQWLAEKAEYTNQYGGKPMLELACAPKNCFVADDGLPAASGTERWGTGYTFYVTYSGQAFHERACRFARGANPTNAYTLFRWSDKHPCGYCRPKLPDLSWYEEYLRIKAIKKKYQID